MSSIATEPASKSGTESGIDSALLMSIRSGGFAVLDGVLGEDEVERLRGVLAASLPSERRGSDGAGSRTVLDACPEVMDLWRCPLLVDLVTHVLGPNAGLVQGLYYDKVHSESWSTPWHKDVMLAVGPGTKNEEAALFGPSRERGGVLQSEAPLSVLRGVLQLRITLDDLNETNGTLALLPGSHEDGKEVVVKGYAPTPVYGRAGSVLVMRPLVAHASGHTRADSGSRRVLVLEFAAGRDLPDGYEWRWWVPVV